MGVRGVASAGGIVVTGLGAFGLDRLLRALLPKDALGWWQILSSFDSAWISYGLIALGLAIIGAANKSFLLGLFDNWVVTWSIRLERSDTLPIRRLIPLKDAARIAYEKTRGTWVSETAERQPADIGGVLGYYVMMLFGDPSITFYGVRPPSTKIEAIPRSELKNGTFIEGGSAFKPFYVDDPPCFEKLAIKRSDLRRRIEEIKRW